MNLAHCIVHGHTVYDLGAADAKRFAPVFNSVEHLVARAPEVLGSHYDIAYPAKQRASARGLRRLPHDSALREHGAHFGQFYGWERPLYFGKTAEPRLRFDRPDWFENVRNEVMAAHQHAAIFDSSPFGKIDVAGPDAEAFLLRVCAGYMARPPGAVVYTAMLNGRGTFESDLTAQRISDDRYRLFVGTSAIKRDLAWLRRHAEGFAVTLTDCTEDYAVFGLMGPDAARVARSAGAGTLGGIGYFRHAPVRLAGAEVRAARLSYVGESGWEFTCRRQDAEAVFAALTAAGARPAGLFAQTAMRIEKGFCAFGHELDTDISPLDVGLSGFTREDGGFIGAEALAERVRSGARSRIVSLVFTDDAAVPLGHEPVYHDGRVIGKTTSTAYGYRVGAPIALALLSAPLADGTGVEVDIARDMFPATLTCGALYDPAGTRMKRG